MGLRAIKQIFIFGQGSTTGIGRFQVDESSSASKDAKKEDEKKSKKHKKQKFDDDDLQRNALKKGPEDDDSDGEESGAKGVRKKEKKAKGSQKTKKSKAKVKAEKKKGKKGGKNKEKEKCVPEGVGSSLAEAMMKAQLAEEEAMEKTNVDLVSSDCSSSEAPSAQCQFSLLALFCSSHSCIGNKWRCKRQPQPHRFQGLSIRSSIFLSLLWFLRFLWFLENLEKIWSLVHADAPLSCQDADAASVPWLNSKEEIPTSIYPGKGGVYRFTYCIETIQGVLPRAS